MRHQAIPQEYGKIQTDGDCREVCQHKNKHTSKLATPVACALLLPRSAFV
jgi:hypothetical protein